MKILRFQDSSGAISLAEQHPDNRFTLLRGELFGALETTDEIVAPAKILAPLAPSCILCIGLNYRHHAAEGGMPIPEYPILFFKTPASVQHPNEPIVLPSKLHSDEVDYECELAVVIGKICKNATRENALDYVLGYTCANDVSARDWQMKRGGGQWSRGKTFDTFCPLGPVLADKNEIPNPNALAIQTHLNGETVQDWNTRDMIFDVPALIEFLSSDTTLLPGTVILTGTPHGVGMARKPPLWLKSGDEVVVEIEGIGELRNSVTGV